MSNTPHSNLPAYVVDLVVAAVACRSSVLIASTEPHVTQHIVDVARLINADRPFRMPHPSVSLEAFRDEIARCRGGTVILTDALSFSNQHVDYLFSRHTKHGDFAIVAQVIREADWFRHLANMASLDNLGGQFECLNIMTQTTRSELDSRDWRNIQCIITAGIKLYQAGRGMSAYTGLFPPAKSIHTLLWAARA